MIKVKLSRPPSNYLADVKTPGQAFLRLIPNPKNTDWARHNYWRKIHDYLYACHNGICFYSASWTPRKRSHNHWDNTSVDHYIPKSLNPQQAFEWSNFRLMRTRLNNRKENFTDVLDPVLINNNWFFLDFATFLIKPSSSTPESIRTRVKQTIERLELNVDQDYVKERIEVIRTYCLSSMSFRDIKLRYPFIAYQMQTQNFDVNFRPKLAALFRR